MWGAEGAELQREGKIKEDVGTATSTSVAPFQVLI